MKVLVTEHRARWFFAAHLQSALGTGAGYVALLLLAYEQLGYAWGATAVLLADLAPAMLLGPLLGGLIDRTSRLGCAIAADADRRARLRRPRLRPRRRAAGRARPGRRPRQRAAAPRHLRAAARGRRPRAPERRERRCSAPCARSGSSLGPALAAGVLLFAAPAGRARAQRRHVRRLRAAADPPARPPHARPPRRDDDEARDERPASCKAVVRALVLTSGAVMLVAGATNVAELVLASDELGAGGTGFALLVARLRLRHARRLAARPSATTACATAT